MSNWHNVYTGKASLNRVKFQYIASKKRYKTKVICFQPKYKGKQDLIATAYHSNDEESLHVSPKIAHVFIFNPNKFYRDKINKKRKLRYFKTTVNSLTVLTDEQRRYIHECL